MKVWDEDESKDTKRVSPGIKIVIWTVLIVGILLLVLNIIPLGTLGVKTEDPTPKLYCPHCGHAENQRSFPTLTLPETYDRDIVNVTYYYCPKCGYLFYLRAR